VLKFARKSCPHCGTECLESDPRCWGCGSWHFTPDPAAAAEPEKTLVGDDGPREVTLSWGAPQRSFGWWGAAAAVGLAIAAAGSTGYWLGQRHAGDARVATSPRSPEAYTTRVLPTPPTRLRTAEDEPEVEIRPLPGQPHSSGSTAKASSPAPAAPAAPVRDTQLLAPQVNGRFASAPRNPAPPRLAPRVTPLPVSPPGPAPGLTLPPESKAAIVSLRNDAPVVVDLHFDGFNGAPDELVTLAPGGAFEMPIGPGDYRLSVVARGGSSDSAKAVFASRQRYAFVIDGRREGEEGRLALKLREPAIDG